MFLRLLVILVMLAPSMGLFAQDHAVPKNEFGFWIGASSPVPGNAVDDVLDSNISGGTFFRMQWPWLFYTEMGFSLNHYPSSTTQSLDVIPAYAALVYQLPLPYRFHVLLKAGGGMAHVVVRPTNRQGWDPMSYAGLEFSVLPGRKFRIGLRIDYENLHERQLAEPESLKFIKYQNYISNPNDLRYIRNDFQAQNGKFFHFGLMFGFVL